MPHIPDSRHSDHDPLAIAAYAAGDATGTELQLASDLVASCADCAALHDDLRAISAALPELPAPARPRDFTLTPEQAASLRPSGWRRFLAPLAGPRFAFAGPLGGGLATLGIAGLLVAGSLGAPVAGTGADGGGTGELSPAAMPSQGTELTGPAGGQPAPSDGALTYKDPEASPVASPLEQLTGPASSQAPDASGDVSAMSGPADSPLPEDDTSTTRALDVDAGSSPPSLLPVVSIAFLVIGVVLGGLWLVGRGVAPRA